MIHTEKKYQNIIQNILKKYPYTFYAFGSRVKGYARQWSDLDLCYQENIPTDTIAQIQEDFEISDLPFRVDIIDYHTCQKSFQDNIQKNWVKLKKD